jgi:hypothetical protein
VEKTGLTGNYPNPFKPETTINYSVKDASPVTICVYNSKGQLVKTLVNDTKSAGVLACWRVGVLACWSV